MQKLSKENMLTQLMIKLDQIEYKIETLQSKFKVFMESHETVPGPVKPFLGITDHKPFSCPDITPRCIDGTGACKCAEPTIIRWPNESYTDYLKRIGEYNVAQSDEEIFREECK